MSLFYYFFVCKDTKGCTIIKGCRASIGCRASKRCRAFEICTVVEHLKSAFKVGFLSFFPRNILDIDS